MPLEIQRLARSLTDRPPAAAPTIRTRRRGKYFTDVRIGTIGVRAGVPVHADQWGWSRGFSPGEEV
jgi:hypothetical protein